MQSTFKERPEHGKVSDRTAQQARVFLSLQSAPGNTGVVQSPSSSLSPPPKDHHSVINQRFLACLPMGVPISGCAHPSVSNDHTIIFPATERVTSLPDSPSPTVGVKKNSQLLNDDGVVNKKKLSAANNNKIKGGVGTGERAPGECEEDK